VTDWRDTPCLSPLPSASEHGNGYYRLVVDGVRHFAHRWAWEQEVGPIPEGLVIDHLCRNRWCRNTLHMEPVTNPVNILRGTSPPAVNARKAECPAGHPYVVKGNGKRRCPICDMARRIASGETSGRGASAERTHCPRGHPYDEQNTYLVLRPDGSVKQRMCRECDRQRVRARRAAQREGR
jgi:hypothetical protein